MFNITDKKNYTEIRVIGKLKHSDYINTLIPELDRLVKKGLISVMIILEDFAGIEARAILDDMKTAIKHRKNFKKLAVVTHKTWMRVAISIFEHLISGEVKIFENKLEAEAWLSLEEAL